MTAPPARPNHADAARRREFVATHVRDARRAGDIPTFGSAAWHRLPYSAPQRWAAVLIAAEAWAADGDDIPGRMRRDLAEQTSVDEQLAAENFTQLAAFARALAKVPSYALLQHRRGELTDQQLLEYDQAAARFVAGHTDQAPRVPRAAAS